MASKPTVSTEWAIGASALKFNPTTQQRTWGWTTSNNLTTGVPEKPTLQHQNGWQNNVHQWITYLEQITDENTIPAQATHAGKFLQTNGTTLSWQNVQALPPMSAPTAGLFLSNNGSIAGWAAVDALPPQATHSGKFLTTNGSVASWAVVDSLPPQATHSGKFLSTNGSVASWQTVDALPPQATHSGKFLTTNGSVASWAVVDSLPAQATNAGKFLQTNGTIASWQLVLPDQTSNGGKFLQTNGTTASWQAASVVNKLTAAASGSIAIDFSLYNLVDATALTGNATFSFTNIIPGRAVTFLIKASSTFTLTWPSGMFWAEGVVLPFSTTVPAAVTVVALGTTVSSLYASMIKTFVSI